MPARSIGTATISFGLVSVPVEVYSTGESAASVSFNMLHKDCGTKLKQHYICPKHEVVVERARTPSKGREFAKDQYVIFTPEELKALEEKAHQFDRRHGVHPAGHGRPHLPGKGLLPGPRQGRRPALPPAGRGAQEDRARRRWASMPPGGTSTWCCSGRWTGCWSWSSSTMPTSCGRPRKCRWAKGRSSRPSSTWRCRSSSRAPVEEFKPREVPRHRP